MECCLTVLATLVWMSLQTGFLLCNSSDLCFLNTLKICQASSIPLKIDYLFAMIRFKYYVNHCLSLVCLNIIMNNSLPLEIQLFSIVNVCRFGAYWKYMNIQYKSKIIYFAKVLIIQLQSRPSSGIWPLY